MKPRLVQLFLLLLILIMLLPAVGGMDEWHGLLRWMLLGIVGGCAALWLQFSSHFQVPRGLFLLLMVWLLSLVPGLLEVGLQPASMLFVTRQVLWVTAVMAMASVIGSSQKIPLVLLGGFLLFVVGRAGFEWLAVLDHGQISHQATYAVMAGFGHRNHLIEIMALCLPVGITLGIREQGWKRSIAFLASAGTVFLLLGMLGRVGWLAIALTALVFFVHYRHRLNRTQVRFILGGSMIALLLLLLVVDEPFTIYHHFEMTVNTSEGTTRDRLLLLERSAELFAQNLFTGIGWGNWPAAIMGFEQFGMLTESATEFYQSPHNDFLWLAAEGGVFPLLAWLVLLAVTLKKILSCALNSQRAMLLSIWLIYVLIACSGYPLQRMEHSLVLGFLLALSWQGSAKTTLPKWSWGFRSFVAFASAFWLFSHIQEARTFSQALAAFVDGDPRSTLNFLDIVSPEYVDRDHEGTPLQWYRGLALLELDKPQEAIIALKKAEEISPHHPWIQNSLGLANYEQNNALALHCFYMATRFTPTYSAPWVNLAADHFRNGRDSAAFATLRFANPKTAGLSYDQLALQLGRDRILNMKANYPERNLQFTLMAIHNTPHWAADVFKKAAMSCETYERQALIEAFYYMLTQCKGEADCAHVLKVKRKYLPNHPFEINGQKVR